MRQLGLLTALVACLCCSVFPRRKRNRRELASTIGREDMIQRRWRPDKIFDKTDRFVKILLKYMIF